MGKLKEAGLVESEKHGIWMYYRLSEALPASTRQVLSQLLS
jgi:DNA-binding transcriptional ArsR family regulator